MLSWFRRRAQIRTTRKNVNFAAGLVQQLESRTLLAATVSASANSITFTGSTGDDTIAVSTDGTNFLLNGVDTTFAIAGRQYINVSGGDGNDTISLNDNLGTRIGLLYGGNGDDSISGGLGADYLYGDAGVDSYSGGGGDDNINVDGDDIGFSGGLGYDRLLAIPGSAGLNVVLTGTSSFEYILGSNNNDTIDASLATNNLVIYGEGGNDTLTGGSGNDLIGGGLGDDTINGGGGSDSLQGDAGTDAYDGGAGNDTISIDNLDAIIMGGTGSDTVQAIPVAGTGLNLILAVGSSVEVLTGTNSDDIIDASATTTPILIYGRGGNDTLFGGSANDTLYGEAGDDSIDGNGGNDSLVGGAGADTLDGDTGSDRASYFDSPAGINIDLIAGVASADGWGTADTIVGSSIENVTGSNSSDIISGSNVDNSLLGLGNDDTIFGLDGNDTIDGGAGNDTLWGGNGTDALTGGLGDDFLDGGAGADSLIAGAGTDTVSYQDQVIAGGVTIFLSSNTASGGDATGDTISGFENATGSNQDDNISGSTGDNVLNGMGGNDRLFGSDGNDSLFGGDGTDQLFGQLGTDLLDGGNGDDTVQADTAESLLAGFTGGAGNDKLVPEATLAPGVGVNWVIGNASFETITGTNNDDVIDVSAGSTPFTVFGQDGNDTITGGSGNDTLKGGNGNDTIDGGAGNDTLQGDAGDDILTGNAGLDAINGNGGNDILYAFTANSSASDGFRDVLNGDAGVDHLWGNIAAAPVFGPDADRLFNFDGDFINS